ncbi:MAG: hypothetical protein AB7S71_10040 [Dongiaceae bacterium]
MKGNALVSALRKKFKCENNNQLSRHLGWTAAQIGNVMQLRTPVSPLRVASLVFRTHAKAQQQQKVLPIAEFAPIERHKPKGANALRIVDPSRHPALCKRLKASHGIYAFYDGNGRVLYVGRATKLDLWTELNQRLNHGPALRQVRALSGKKAKATKLKRVKILFSDAAKFYSAYEVPMSSQIHNLEALIIRIAPNDLRNVHLEQFIAD